MSQEGHCDSRRETRPNKKLSTPETRRESPIRRTTRSKDLPVHQRWSWRVEGNGTLHVPGPSGLDLGFTEMGTLPRPVLSRVFPQTRKRHTDYRLGAVQGLGVDSETLPLH